MTRYLITAKFFNFSIFKKKHLFITAKVKQLVRIKKGYLVTL